MDKTLILTFPVLFFNVKWESIAYGDCWTGDFRSGSLAGV